MNIYASPGQPLESLLLVVCAGGRFKYLGRGLLSLQPEEVYVEVCAGWAGSMFWPSPIILKLSCLVDKDIAPKGKRLLEGD